MYTHEIILCQPESSKGCSACCGLFNLRDISRENLLRFLDNEKKNINNNIDCETFSFSNAEKLMNSIRDITSHICEFQGFIRDGKPGCTLHPKIRKQDLRDNSFFGGKICDEFLCPAHSILDSEMKRLLITHVLDWYQYAIAIIDPESFLWIIGIIRKYVDIFSKETKERERITNMITAALKLHADFLNKQKLPVFFYSLSEYSMGKKSYSLFSDSENVVNHQKNIIDKIVHLA